MYTLARRVVGPIYRLLFRIRVTGRENIPLDGGVILCANHTAYSDVVVLGMISPRDLSFVAKEELFKGKFLNRLFTSLGAIPINREKPSMDTFKRIVKILKEGNALAIFMQGGRRKKGEEMDTEDYKAGVALFAIKGQVPVVPINIKSTFKPFSKIHINIGEAISFEEHWGQKMRAEDFDKAAGKVMDAIAALGGS
ncbi:MAG: 1-acyl-sn-glycerol-3-phosphate acyltransferase [Defluviitaleaceae bacterium]|nr:1-acyl-sn-glycerol-3-phosphate acyltransferase [Defluviitaleaceae bacterium]